jgi:hypothetical protein
MYMDKGEGIRFRVTGEQFCDTTPIPCAPSQDNSTGGQQQAASSSSAAEQIAKEEESQKIPYSLTVCTLLYYLFN